MDNSRFDISLVKFSFAICIIMVVPGLFSEYDFIRVFVNFLSDFIPSINRSGAATNFPEKTRIAWAFIWAFSPCLFLLYFRITGGDGVGGVRYTRGFYWICILLFLSGILIAYFGVPYHNSNEYGNITRMNSFFRKSIFGMYLLTSIIWTMCFFSYAYIKKYFKNFI